MNTAQRSPFSRNLQNINNEKIRTRHLLKYELGNCQQIWKQTRTTAGGIQWQSWYQLQLNKNTYKLGIHLIYTIEVFYLLFIYICCLWQLRRCDHIFNYVFSTIFCNKTGIRNCPLIGWIIIWQMCLLKKWVDMHLFEIIWICLSITMQLWRLLVG